MFPIDAKTRDYNRKMLAQFDALPAVGKYTWKLEEILPKVLVAGENAGTLTEEGAKLLDPSGRLEAGIPLCPPEGDAGTGMVATNSVAVRTGNVSAGTSVFAMVVLAEDLKAVHEELDMVTTPSGDTVAMVHCNNCTSDLNAWVGLFREFAENFGINVDMNELSESFTIRRWRVTRTAADFWHTTISRESRCPERTRDGHCLCASRMHILISPISCGHICMQRLQP